MCYQGAHVLDRTIVGRTLQGYFSLAKAGMV
jgi:hypothetical protein